MRGFAARDVVGLAAATSVLSVVLAAAASIGWSSGSLGFGYAATPRCTSAALGVLPTLSAGLITAVTVGPLPSACDGALLEVTVGNGIASSGGTTVVPAQGGSVTVVLAAAVAVTGAVQTDLVLIGP